MAARTGCHENRADFAARAQLSVHVVEGAEDGTRPAWECYPEFMALADAVAAPHPSWRELFETAAACDLLVTCLLDGDQAMATDVLADDDTRDTTVALLRWAITGTPGRPARRAHSMGARTGLRTGCWTRAADAAAAAGGGTGPVELAGRVGRRRDRRASPMGDDRRVPGCTRAQDYVPPHGAYVRRSKRLAESWDGTWDDSRSGRHDCRGSWATATAPVMSPGFVRRHPRVISAAVQFNAWDATLTGPSSWSRRGRTRWPAPVTGGVTSGGRTGRWKRSAACAGGSQTSTS